MLPPKIKVPGRVAVDQPLTQEIVEVERCNRLQINASCCGFFAGGKSLGRVNAKQACVLGCPSATIHGMPGDAAEALLRSARQALANAVHGEP